MKLTEKLKSLCLSFYEGSEENVEQFLHKLNAAIVKENTGAMYPYSDKKITNKAKNLNAAGKIEYKPFSSKHGKWIAKSGAKSEGKMFDSKEKYLEMLKKNLGEKAQEIIDAHRSFIDKSFDMDVSIPELAKSLKKKESEPKNEATKKALGDWYTESSGKENNGRVEMSWLHRPSVDSKNFDVELYLKASDTRKVTGSSDGVTWHEAVLVVRNALSDKKVLNKKIYDQTVTKGDLDFSDGELKEIFSKAEKELKRLKTFGEAASEKGAGCDNYDDSQDICVDANEENKKAVNYKAKVMVTFDDGDLSRKPQNATVKAIDAQEAEKLIREKIKTTWPKATKIEVTDVSKASLSARVKEVFGEGVDLRQSLTVAQIRGLKKPKRTELDKEGSIKFFKVEDASLDKPFFTVVDTEDESEYAGKSTFSEKDAQFIFNKLVREK